MAEKTATITGSTFVDQANRGDLRSDAVQEIISLSGGFLTRWALWVFLLVIVLIVAGAWFIKCPEVVEARAAIIATNAVNQDNTSYYAQVMLSQSNRDKLDTGQQVQLRIDTYPYQEFGFVAGKLQFISDIPSDSGFLSTIQLSKGLVTNYNKTIQYRKGLKSSALIFTKDVRLLQQLYNSIVKGVNK